MKAATPLPRLALAAGSLSENYQPFSMILKRWHVACLFLGVCGCFDFRPLSHIKKNEAPVIVDQVPHSGTPLILKDRSVEVHVLATDPDGVNFQWSYSDGTLIGSAQQVGEGTSLVVLDPDPSLAGEELRCIVYDGAEVPASVVLTWPLEVP
jgi:hypothetical protein